MFSFHIACLGALLIFPIFPTTVRADEAKPSSPYTLPWQLRSVMAADVVRIDSAFASYYDSQNHSDGSAAAPFITGAHKLSSDFALVARWGMVKNSPPNSAPAATSYTNPLIGGVYSLNLPDNFRLGLFLGVTIPGGSGSGNFPNPAVRAANSEGILARSAMDNALFATNYLSIIPGIDLAYISSGWTLQAEATLLQLNRVGGDKIDKDPYRTNFTSGLFAGYSLAKELALAGEIRYQRWLSNNTVFGTQLNPAIQNMSFAVGPRFTFKIGETTFKPGIAYEQGLLGIGPMATDGYNYPVKKEKIAFVDLPVFF